MIQKLFGAAVAALVLAPAAGAADAVQCAHTGARLAAAIAGITVCHLTGLLSLGFGVYYSAAQGGVPQKRSGDQPSERSFFRME